MSIITTARDHPDKPATIMAGSGDVTTYAQLLAQAEQLARVLLTELRAGDRIAMICANEPGYLVAAWAARRAGLHFVPVNWHLTLDEAGYIVRNSDARALVASASLGDVAKAIAADDDALVLRLSIGGAIDGFVAVEEAIASAPATPLPDGPDGNPMFYSSGTTGRPKGILRALGNAPFASSTAGEELLGTIFSIDADTVLLIPAPLYHAAPMGWSQAAQGLDGTVVVMERFDPEALLAAVEKYRVTHINCVPIHLIRLLRLPEEVRNRYDLSSLRHVVHAAAPCPPDVKRAMIEWLGPVVEEFYSASEAAGFCTVTSEEWLRKPGTVGRPLSGRVRVAGEDGRLLPPGEPGLLYFEATPRFVYHNDAEKTEGFFDADGWGCNGDIGWVDEDGYLFLADRKSNMIISGGVNIYPQEVENQLINHPAVADVAVIGVPNPEYGEEVKAVVELRPEAAGSPDDAMARDLIAFCRDRLAGFKCPRSVDFVDRLPRHENGKLLKRELKARYDG
ncbi:fatty-acyl-CoA synthase [Sphingobium wenxiniae]|uniref:Acyl-CoA synthetase n=2 Tax=Sphingobium TaxID=165695 RepID=T0GEC9_9SPHN|nr:MULTISPECIES: AMP-binding protein [Sphingobium]EQA98387.1 hypothetical protein L485_17045 [Sphingobium baderi LL03]KMS61320.1 acyl-CoA synthetase [Sphingobium baderi LL03]MBB6191898.1 fatty-acyl-CoA synthase [Sphingobium wenxiniae]TWH96677.1 acyl-CoA synthetase (AMP-forming)/AMP-acid ligase II [Sphingobium wenxiniae]WRD75537.1 acyl-CoA synthetase [Sphingobium baderi]